MKHGMASVVSGLVVGLSGLIGLSGPLARPAIAQPADIFRPHINEMVTSVPPGFAIRLPSDLYVNGSRILLNGRGELVTPDVNPFTVEVYASKTPLSLVVSILSCDSAVTRSPCVFGTVTNDRSSSIHARTELDRHRRMGDPLTFKPGVRGYLIDGARPGTRSKFSSVVWQQENMIYTLSFPAASSRQSLIDMARTMALSEPVRPSLPRSIPASVPPL